MRTRSTGERGGSAIRQFLTRHRYLSHGLLLALVCVSVVAACSPGGSAPPAAQVPTPLPTNPLDVARLFLDSWVNGAYADMYRLTSHGGFSLSPKAFEDIYRNAESTMGVGSDGKSYEILQDQSFQQGTTYVVKYNMTFDSGSLGKFTDPNRTMRLINTDGVWRVSWSQMDIFEGMAGGAALTLQQTLSTRGTIYDRNGNPIAQSNVPNVAVRLITNDWYGKTPEDCLAKLTEIFHLDAALAGKYLTYLRNKQDFGFTVGTLSPDQVTQYRDELKSVCKIQYVDQTSRFYYGNGLAAQTLGYVASIQKGETDQYLNYPKDALVGRTGLEKAFESQLAGQPGAQLVIDSPDGTLIRVIAAKPPGSTQDLTVTIDRDFQLAVEQALSSAYWDANWGQYSAGQFGGAAAVVLNANTGEVLAIASYPSVNPDAFRLDSSFDTGGATPGENNVLLFYDQQYAGFNRALQGTYSLGSVMKIVSMAAGAGSGNFQPTQTYTCTGKVDFSQQGDRLRLDWIYTDKYSKKNNHGTITLIQALTSSCDAYFWQVGAKLNNADPWLFQKYANMMGLGVKTGIGASLGPKYENVIPDAEGYIPNPDTKLARKGIRWGLGDSLNTVIGQGDVQVSPVQVARMMMGVANGGKLFQPYLVKSLGPADGPPTLTPDISVPVDITQDPNVKLDSKVIRAIQQGLCDVPRDKNIGTAYFVFSDWDFNNISVCAKTGTAQTGAPYPNGWFGSYAGKAGGKPDIAIAVVVLRSREGSETAGPITRRIIEAYYNLPISPWPDYWTYPYDPLTNPDDVSDGGSPPPKR